MYFCQMKWIWILALSCTFGTLAQKSTIGFYNVENLFDTINDPTIDDEEFLPQAENQWNSKRYHEKIQHINQVMDLMGKNLVALGTCEIENEQVLREVIQFNPKRANKWGVVHYNSSDARGIDVGLLYDSTKLRLIQSGYLRFPLATDTEGTTRDILWAKFVRKKDTLFMMVNHWPSRRGGEEKSEPNRLAAAQKARIFIDSIEKSNPSYSLVFMGDLNDYPTNNAPKLVAEKLTPMITKESGKFGGSYSYKGQWDVLDHIMVSPNLAQGKKPKVNLGTIYSPDFLLEEFKGNTVPFRTYGGRNYLGGFSDHLPVSIPIKL